MKRKSILVLFMAISILVLSYNLFVSQERSNAMSAKDNQKEKPAICGLPLKDEELKKILTPEQYRIMRQNGTEAPFANAYWNNKKTGIYVDAISGEVLFSSADKFDSGTGWPSFTKPVNKDSIIAKTDTSHGMARTEVRAKNSNSHLGHIFDDGPKPTNQRYCINSASLRFIPVEELEKQGYGQYLSLFSGAPSLKQNIQSAYFAAGCFWGVEEAFRHIDGVVATTVGYMGGSFKNPTYEDVSAHKTGHAEIVKVEFDPSRISYEKLLEIFWKIHDPTTLNKQGPDAGSQYRSVIFYSSPEQEKAARLSKERLEKSHKFKQPIVTEIVPDAEFYAAEDYHQKYFAKRGITPACHIPLK